MAGVRLVGVSKRFGGVVAVRGLDLVIADGEFIVLVGPSGCGKTTTLRMIAGLEDPSEGDIFIGDRRVNGVDPKDRDIAMVFQNYALYPHMDVYENMAFGLRLRRADPREIDRRVREAAAVLGIEPLLRRRPRELSGGQRQRVALGRAIVRRPSVFLMDEPLSNLDAKLRAQMRTEIVRLQRQLGTTTVYVTHDQVEAMTMGDRIVVMKDGVVQQVAPPRELYERPANLFVAEFIGSPTMNFLEAEVRSAGSALSAEGPGFHLALADPGAHSGVRRDLPRHVVLGIRPEALRIESNASNEEAPVDASARETGGSTTVRGRVELVEVLGADTFVHVVLPDGLRWTVRAPGDAGARPGDVVAVRVDPQRVHLFHPETGLAI